jgi:hypothetical protein
MRSLRPKSAATCARSKPINHARIAASRRQDVANRDDVRDCVSYERPYREPWKLKVYPA